MQRARTLGRYVSAYVAAVPTVFCPALPLCSKHKANNCCSGSVAFAQRGAPTSPLVSPRSASLTGSPPFLKFQEAQRKGGRRKKKNEDLTFRISALRDRRRDSEYYVAIAAREARLHGDCRTFRVNSIHIARSPPLHHFAHGFRQSRNGIRHSTPASFPASVVPTRPRRPCHTSLPPVIQDSRTRAVEGRRIPCSPIATPGVSTPRPDTVYTGQITLPRDAHGTPPLVRETRLRRRERP